MIKTITYNPETHVLVPREPTPLQLQNGSEIDLAEETPEAYQEFLRDIYLSMVAAAPQPEQVDSEPVAYRHRDGMLSCRLPGGPTKGIDWTPLYTTPQPDRVAELEQLRQRIAELEERRCEVCGYAEHHREHTGCLRKQIEKLTAERDAALARLSEERDIWDRMLGDAADKFAHLEREIDDCLYVLDALWDKQCDKIVTQKWAEILIRNKRVTGASSAEDS